MGEGVRLSRLLSEDDLDLVLRVLSRVFSENVRFLEREVAGMMYSVARGERRRIGLLSSVISSELTTASVVLELVLLLLKSRAKRDRALEECWVFSDGGLVGLQSLQPSVLGELCGRLKRLMKRVRTLEV
jgi:hypothetical protein